MLLKSCPVLVCCCCWGATLQAKYFQKNLGDRCSRLIFFFFSLNSRSSFRRCSGGRLETKL